MISTTTPVVSTQLAVSIVRESLFKYERVQKCKCRDCNVCGLQHDCTVVILSSIIGPLAQRLTYVATAMFGGATTGDVGRVEGIALDGVARLLPAFLYQELDDVHVDGGSEDGL